LVSTQQEAIQRRKAHRGRTVTAGIELVQSVYRLQHKIY